MKNWIYTIGDLIRIVWYVGYALLRYDVVLRCNVAEDGLFKVSYWRKFGSEVHTGEISGPDLVKLVKIAFFAVKLGHDREKRAKKAQKSGNSSLHTDSPS